MNNKTFTCDAGTFTIDEAINGQSQLAFYDSLAQVALRPSLREGTVLCYWKQGIEGLFAQLQALIKADNRVVKTNPYYWTEQCAEETITVTVKKSLASVPAAGATVTLTLAPNSHSATGKASRPRAGYRAYIKENGRQGANITAVSKSVTGAHTITLEPLNGEVLDLTKFDTYTIVIDTLKMYVKGDLTCMTGHGLVQNPPVLRKGYVQKFEDSIEVHEDEIDGYAYENEFHVVKGISPVTGKPVDMWCAPQVNEQLQAMVIDSRNINTLIGIRDDKKQQGFDGIVTTAEGQGMFSAGYEPASGVSLKQILMSMIRKLRKTNGCNDYMLLADFGFLLDWSEGIAAMVKEFGQNYIFSLFGKGGTGSQNFEYFNFQDFKAFNYNFRTFQIDGFDARRYGYLLENFAMMVPACPFKDTNGATVPPLTYTNIAGCEPAKQKNMWVDDTRQRRCRIVAYNVKDSYGLEIHCASKLGVMKRSKCA